jgi:hypothetical protein
VTTDESTRPFAFAWNAGGWFGTQIGCTLWLLILGFVLLSKDSLVAWLCVASFLVLNAWGLYLWRSRERLTAYAGLQRFLLMASVIIAVVVVVVNDRGLSEPPAPGALVSTYLPYWVVLAAPALMLLFFWRERRAKRGRR